MKHIFSLLFIFTILNGFSQITIVGAKKTEIISNNQDKNEVKEIDLNFTKTREERPNYVIKNEIKNSTVNTNEEKIQVVIPNSESAKDLKDNETNQIVISLDKAKNTIQNSNSGNNSFETNNNTNTVTTTTQDNDKINTNEISVSKPNAIMQNNSFENETIQPSKISSEKSDENNIETTVPQKGIFAPNSFNEEIEFETEVEQPQSGITFESKKPIVEKTVIEEPKTSIYNTSNTLNSSNTSGNLNSLDKIDSNNSSNSNSEESSNVNPKNGSWSLGLRAGVPAIIGDVNSRAGYGTSLSLQKAIGHVFSLRFQALFLETFGLNTNVNTYQNYKTRFSDYTLQGVFTLNNLSFYKKEPKVLYNVIVGGGLATRYTWTDLRNANDNLYSYDNVSTTDIQTRKTDLLALLDKKYETHIPKDADKMSIKNTNILPTVLVGMGLDIKLSEKFDLNLETRFSNHFDDNLDGYKNGTNTDWMTFTSLGLTYKFGSKAKSLRWSNPVYSKVEEINDLKKKVNDGDLLKDEDKDGIADIFDQDLNTPARVAVDSRGIPSDMDRDGVADYEDAEPFTPIGAKVNAKGVAIDTDNDGIADILDLEPNTIGGNQVDANGKSIIIPTQNNTPSLSSVQSNSDFDLIFFDENSSRVGKEFYSTMYKVARYIQANPNTRIQITGYTDVLATESYNMNLSERRANEVYSMLVQMFKVSSNNLTTNFAGENNPIIEGLPEQKDSSQAAAYYINRRVEFRIIK